jgi:hypothetical protein
VCVCVMVCVLWCVCVCVCYGVSTRTHISVGGACGACGRIPSLSSQCPQPATPPLPHMPVILVSPRAAVALASRVLGLGQCVYIWGGRESEMSPIVVFPCWGWVGV